MAAVTPGKDPIIGTLKGGENAGEWIVFTASSQAVRTLQNWKWSGSANWAVHKRHSGNALTEFTGLNPDEISFDIILNRELNTDPMGDIKRLWRFVRTGEPVALTVGGHCYGRYRWAIISLTVSIEHTDAKGQIYMAVVSLKLKEYLSC